VRKSPGFGKGKKVNGMANKRLTTILAPNQPNAMGAQFTHLEVLVTSMAFNMATHVKPKAHVLGDYLAQGFDLGFFCGARFLRPLGPNEIKLNIFDDHVLGAINDKTLVSLLTFAPITRGSVKVHEP
jgi:hypothetical protein